MQIDLTQLDCIGRLATRRQACWSGFWILDFGFSIVDMRIMLLYYTRRGLNNACDMRFDVMHGVRHRYRHPTSALSYLQYLRSNTRHTHYTGGIKTIPTNQLNTSFHQHDTFPNPTLPPRIAPQPRPSIASLRKACQAAYQPTIRYDANQSQAWKFRFPPTHALAARSPG